MAGAGNVKPSRAYKLSTRVLRATTLVRTC
jgi:hypothetical protein